MNSVCSRMGVCQVYVLVTDGNLRLLGKNEDRRLAGRLFFSFILCINFAL